jgi:hypothetical protein
VRTTQECRKVIRMEMAGETKLGSTRTALAVADMHSIRILRIVRAEAKTKTMNVIRTRRNRLRDYAARNAFTIYYYNRLTNRIRINAATSIFDICSTPVEFLQISGIVVSLPPMKEVTRCWKALRQRSLLATSQSCRPPPRFKHQKVCPRVEIPNILIQQLF